MRGSLCCEFCDKVGLIEGLIGYSCGDVRYSNSITDLQMRPVTSCELYLKLQNIVHVPPDTLETGP